MLTSTRARIVSLAALAAAAVFVAALVAAQAPATRAAPAQQGLDVATFASGCFWSTEYDFDKVEGVRETTSGFMARPSPHVRAGFAGGTGYAEAGSSRTTPRSSASAASTTIGATPMSTAAGSSAPRSQYRLGPAATPAAQAREAARRCEQRSLPQPNASIAEAGDSRRRRPPPELPRDEPRVLSEVPARCGATARFSSCGAARRRTERRGHLPTAHAKHERPG
jgi:hypothetical protein